MSSYISKMKFRINKDISNPWPTPADYINWKELCICHRQMLHDHSRAIVPSFQKLPNWLRSCIHTCSIFAFEYLIHHQHHTCTHPSKYNSWPLGVDNPIHFRPSVQVWRYNQTYTTDQLFFNLSPVSWELFRVSTMWSLEQARLRWERFH